MDKQGKCPGLKTAIITLVIMGIMFATGFYRIKLETDIVATLPKNDPVVADAGYVLGNNFIRDKIIIDISCEKYDPDLLVAIKKNVEKALKKTGLFNHLGTDETWKVIPEIMAGIPDFLPVLFSYDELEQKIKPLLSFEKIEKKFKEHLIFLTRMDSIGSAKFMGVDPLGFKNIVLKRLSGLAPSMNVKIYKNSILSSDRLHILTTATPKGSGTNTDFARKAVRVFDSLEKKINKNNGQNRITITATGAFRAALDNENMAKHDMKLAMIFSTLGIALLLIFAFPRPYIGILSLFPAIFGSIAAFFTYSFIYPSISLLTLGFGGALISITVDHGIAYLLFLDRPEKTRGKDAAKEVLSVGFLAALTTIGAFFMLSFSGFPILVEIGQFAAMGIFFSFVFVHTVFPEIFPQMEPAKRTKPLPIRIFVDNFALKYGKAKLWGAGCLAFFMIWFANPGFHVDLKSMNTTSQNTKNAEALISKVWGDIFTKIFIMAEAENLSALKDKMDKAAYLVMSDIKAKKLKSGFVPSMIFPGENMCKKNFSAWKKFWNKKRVGELKKNFKKISQGMGFTENAFDPFFRLIDGKKIKCPDISFSFYELMGISRIDKGKKWIWFSSLSPGDSYEPGVFYKKYSKICRVFDPGYFGQRLGVILSEAFIRMAVIIAVSILILLFIFFRSIKLTFMSVLPLIFAFICTLGTLKLLGRSLDIPSIMLSIVILGMGIDYSLFFVRSYQHYKSFGHPSAGLIRMAVFLAAASTLLGFGVLCFAEHNLLRSAGLVTFLGIGYSLLGTFAILPPMLDC